MRRGEIWTIAGGSPYATKPRPVVILQSDRFDNTESITVCPLTSVRIEGRLFRIPVFPDEANGLRSPSWLSADKLLSVPKTNLGTHIGHIDEHTLTELSRAVTIFLNLAPDPPAPRR